MLELFVIIAAVVGGFIFWVNTQKQNKTVNSTNSNNRHSTIQTNNELQISDNKVENAEKFHFITKKLMNGEEDTLYKRLVALFIKEKLFQEKKFKLLCQVGVGGFIDAPNQDNFKGTLIFGKTIGALRVDYLVIDEKNNPVIVIEYHGKGHYQGNYKTNDRLKEILFNKTGIKLVIIENESAIDAKFTEISNYLAWHYQSLKPTQQ